MEHMYQFSLTSFIALFSRTLRKPMEAKSIEMRITNLVRFLIQRLLYYVGRSLFKADRLMYAMHLVHVMFPGKATLL